MKAVMTMVKSGCFINAMFAAFLSILPLIAKIKNGLLMKLSEFGRTIIMVVAVIYLTVYLNVYRNHLLKKFSERRKTYKIRKFEK